MHKIIVFTDIHMVEGGRTLIGLDPGARFADVLAHALQHHPDAAHVVISGDLAHDGAPEQYARLRGILDACPLPVSVIPGNHDRRAALVAAFRPPVTERGHVQRVLDVGGHRLILLDTLDEDAPDLHSGHLCDARLAWLDAALADAGTRPVTIVTHHPPMETGFSAMDAIGLRNRDALLGRLAASNANVVQIISGHIHRTLSGGAGGFPVAVFKSPCHQMPMDLGGDNPHLSVDEPGAYGLLLLTGDGVIVHSQDVGLPASLAIDHY